MFNLQTKETLQRLGININRLLKTGVNFLDFQRFFSVKGAENALSTDEIAILTELGAVGLGKLTDSDNLVAEANRKTIATEYGQIIDTALTQKSVSQLLGVCTSRVRLRIDERSLYAVLNDDHRICPAFQFNGNATIPGLKKVLLSIGDRVHPVAVQRFFLTKTIDLETELGNETQILSPRDWLIDGHEVEPVCLIAAEL